MKPDAKAFLDALEKIRVNTYMGRRAPHKPLLLLLALGRVLNGKERLVAYRDVQEPLTGLLKHYGPKRDHYHAFHPFWRLCNDEGLWEIPGFEDMPRGKDDRVNEGGLLENAARGGFPGPLHQVLKADRELVRKAAHQLLNEHFPQSLHESILQDVGLADIELPESAQESAARQKRNPNFRRDVLNAYERCCAVCGFDIRLEDNLLGLEAAHIYWHAYGGPDEVRNGLALCTFHHRSLDKGALGLQQAPGDDGFQVLVSSDINGSSNATRWLLDYAGKPLRPPWNKKHGPNPEYVKWHFKEVFHGPARGEGAAAREP